MIARLLVTKKCQRTCSYCCNNHKVLRQAKVIKSLTELNHETVCVTGGEPLLNPPRTLSVLEELRGLVPTRLIYLYTALYNKELIRMIPFLDGVHYTLHKDSSWVDLDLFNEFQDLIANELYKKMSFRLFVHPEMDKPIKILPYVWKRMEIKPFLKDCPLPENEELFILSKFRYEQGEDNELERDN